MINYRMPKINSLISETVSDIINKKFAEDIHFININFVDTARDLSETKIYVSFIDRENTNFKKLLSKRKNIQSIFAQSIKLRKTPKIIFILDIKKDSINKVEALLEKISHEN